MAPLLFIVYANIILTQVKCIPMDGRVTTSHFSCLENGSIL